MKQTDGYLGYQHTKRSQTRNALILFLILVDLFTGGCWYTSTKGIPSETPEAMNKERWPNRPAKDVNNVWYLNENSETVLMFVHGLFSDSSSCWFYTDRKDEKKSQYWPELVRADPRLGKLDIYLGGYYTALDSREFDARDASRDLWAAMNRVSLDGEPPVINKKNIIFVAHSTGGIVVRHMLVQHKEKFRDKKVGLILIASPSSGSDLANWLGGLASFYKNRLGSQLQVGNPFIDNLDKEFKDLVDTRVIPNLIGVEAVENHPIKYLPHLVVEESSAGRYFSSPVRLRHTDHSTTVKPYGLDHPSHELLVDFVERFRRFHMASSFHEKIRLTVGLSSEHPEPFDEALQLHASTKNMLYQKHGGAFEIVTEKMAYDDAYLAFNHPGRYDIIMMDDIWLPEFAPSLTALETLRSDPSEFGHQWFNKTFVNSLWFSCIDKKESTTIYGLPVLGNVELLLYRDDLIDPRETTLPGDPDSLIDFLRKQAGQDRLKPIALRYQSGNDSVEIFWNILRWYGYQDEVVNGEVRIPRRLADKALSWMKTAQAIGFESKEFGSKEIRKKLLYENDLAMAFGWPGWVLREFLVPQEKAPSPVKTLYWPHPAVLGTWVFGIPKYSKHQEEALEAILLLATDPYFQRFLAQRGGVPTLREFPRNFELMRNPFWQANRPTVMKAMESGRPRPRTPNWRKIEYDLGHQLKEGVLQDKPGLFRFTAD